MKRTFLILILLFPLVLFAQRETDANLLGHVTNAKTGEHLPYAQVQIMGTTIGAITDETGHFHIANCPEGLHTVIVHALGYKQMQQPVTLKRNNTLEVNFQLEPDAIALNQVVITATQHAVSRMEAPAIVGVIDRQQLEAQNALNLADGLRQQTGVCIENTCQNCGAFNVRLNGLDGAYSQVLIDSRPINSALASVYLLEQLPASMIEQIEVLRGGGSALYGSNAIAGVINVITREPLRNTASISNTTALLGNNAIDWSNAFNATVVSDNRKAGIALYGYNRQRSPYDRDGDGFSELPLLKVRMLGLRGFLRTGLHSKLNLEYHNIHDYRRGGNDFDLPSNQALVSEGGEHDIHSAQLKWDWLASDGLSHLSAFASTQYVDRQSYYGEREPDEPFGNAYGFTTDLTANTGVLYSRRFNKLLFMPAELTAGAEYTLDRLADRTLQPADSLQQHTAVASLYVQNEWHNEHWNLLVGLRADRHTLLAHPVFSPRFNLRYAPSHHLVFRAGYSSGFRAPQLYDEDLHVGAVNGQLYKVENTENLREERSHSLSLSTDFCFHLGKVEGDLLVEGFYTQINDAFVLQQQFGNADTNDPYIRYYRFNTDGAHVGGINTELRLTLTDQLQFQLGATLQRSRYDGQGKEWSPNRYEQRLERVPDHYAHLALTYNPTPRWSLLLNGTLTGPMLVYHTIADDDDGSKHAGHGTIQQVTTPSFFDLSLKLSHRFPLTASTSLELSGGIQNIFDSFQSDFDSGHERDASFIYGPTRPRTLFLSLKLSI